MGRKSKKIPPIDAGIADAYAPECWEQKRPDAHRSETRTDTPPDAVQTAGLLGVSRRVWGYLTTPY